MQPQRPMKWKRLMIELIKDSYIKFIIFLNFEDLFNSDQLVFVKMTSNQKILINSPIHDEILSNFNTFDYIKALGDPADLILILGYNLTAELLLCVEDKKKRELKLLIGSKFPYIKDYGPSDLCQFTNSCVPDSILAAFHTAYIKYPNIENLLNRNNFFREVMSLLNKKKYLEARKHFVRELNPGTHDLYSNVKDYFPLIRKLACAEITYKQNPPNDCAIHKEIPSIIKKYGDIIVLGDPSCPTLILVHREVYNDLYQDCQSTELPPHVDDEKRRIFVLQFLLLGKETHMTMCFQFCENKWYLYDNDPEQPSFQPFDLKNCKNYVICLAGYVNITQDQECKLGIPETGEAAGAKPFNLVASSSIYFDPGQSVEDMEVQDTCSLSEAIVETGEGLGTKPFQDIEMVSCSSSDSD